MISIDSALIVIGLHIIRQYLYGQPILQHLCVVLSARISLIIEKINSQSI